MQFLRNRRPRYVHLMLIPELPPSFFLLYIWIRGREIWGAPNRDEKRRLFVSSRNKIQLDQVSIAKKKYTAEVESLTHFGIDGVVVHLGPETQEDYCIGWDFVNCEVAIAKNSRNQYTAQTKLRQTNCSRINRPNYITIATVINLTDINVSLIHWLNREPTQTK